MRLKPMLLRLFIILALALPFLALESGRAMPASQSDEAISLAAEILDTLSPEERVGQLFLVTFEGTGVGQNTQINDLINQHYIGGVVLLADNNNFTASTFNLNNLWTLITANLVP